METASNFKPTRPMENMDNAVEKMTPQQKAELERFLKEQREQQRQERKRQVEQGRKDALVREEKYRQGLLTVKPPTPQKGQPYTRPNGAMARGADRKWLPWFNDETEKQLLQKMLAEYIEAIGGAAVVRKILGL